MNQEKINAYFENKKARDAEILRKNSLKEEIIKKYFEGGDNTQKKLAETFAVPVSFIDTTLNEYFRNKRK